MVCKLSLDEKCKKLEKTNQRVATNTIGYTRKQATDEEESYVHKKASHLDEEAFIKIERHRSIQDSREFHKRQNNVRRPFKPQIAMSRAKNGELLTNKNQVLA
jgi:hypothetical protein